MLLVLAWTTSTVLAVGVAAAAVGAVRGQVTDVPSVPIQSAATSLAAAAEPALKPPVSPSMERPAEADASVDQEPVEGATSTIGADGSETSLQSTTTIPSGRGENDNQSTTSTTSTTDATPATTAPTTTTTIAPPPSTTTTTAAAAPAPYSDTSELVGGTVTVIVDTASATVTFSGATVAAGFTVSVEKSGPEKVVVKFESETHESEYVGRFEEGAFVSSTDEQDRSGHDGD